MKIARIANLPRLLVPIFCFSLHQGAQAGESMHKTTLTGPLLLSLSGQIGLRGEANLSGKAALAIEGMFQSQTERMSEKEIEETGGDSLKTWGREYALLISRYSEPSRLAGWNWTMGFGHRTLQVDWRKSRFQPANSPALAGDEVAANETSEREYFALNAKGPTGHIRAGYRYIGQDWPIVWSFEVGLRHFQSRLANRKDEQGDEIGSTMNHRTEHSLKSQLKTAMTGGLSVGYAF